MIEVEAKWDCLASSMRLYGELTLAVLLAVEAGELSEGRAVELLMINREDLRDLRSAILKQTVALAEKCKSPLRLLLDRIKAEQQSSKASRSASASRGKGRRKTSASPKRTS